MRNWASTRSMPVTCSVTVCSTWIRALHSIKKCSPDSGRDQKFYCAGVDETGLAGELQGVRHYSRPKICVEAGRGSKLKDLLVSLLHRTVALVEVDDVPLRIRENLHLDVTRSNDELFHIERAVSKGGFGLASATFERFVHVSLALYEAYSAAASAGGGL